MLDIILPCYNSDRRMLDQALVSLARQQAEYQWRCWVIDDGSDSEQAELMSFSYRFCRFARIKHAGLPTALNIGHKVSDCSCGCAKYVCWTSDDNMLEPDFVQAMVETAERGPYDFVRCLERHLPGGEIVDPRHGNSALPVAGLYDGYLGAGHLYSRSLYERTAGYDPEMAGIEDLDMYYQLMQLNPRVGWVDRVLYTYRDGTSRFAEERVVEARKKLIAKWGLK